MRASFLLEFMSLIFCGNIDRRLAFEIVTRTLAHQNAAP